MKARQLILILTVLWLAAYAASLRGLFLLEPTGDGFTRGLNRLTAFAGWQVVAGTFAVGLWLAGRDLRPGSLKRWLSRVPALLALLLALAIVAIIAYARLSKPAQDLHQTPPQTAVPAD